MSLMEVSVGRKHGSNNQFELGTKRIIDDQSAMPDEGGDAEYKTRVQPCNIRETAIEYLFTKGEVEADLKQAADQFRKTCEAARMSGGVIDPGALRVDQHMSMAVKPHAIDAARDLAKIQGRLGIPDFALLVQSCTAGRSIIEITRLVYGVDIVNDNDRKYLGRRIRDALVVVSAYFAILSDTATAAAQQSGWRATHRSLNQC